jgi:endonuclease/exonuclease/phosphatase family metal-dependent hydrolase
VLLRTWNVFHGNTVPPGRVNLLEEAVRLAASGDPTVVCLQELPLWSLEYMDDWSGMIALGKVAARPRAPRGIGRRLTELNPGLLRSAFTGQANALLVATGRSIVEASSIVLNPGVVRRRLDVPLAARIAWAKERRVCQAVRLALPDERTMTVANLHATSYQPDKRLAAVAAPGDIIVLAGDFNLRPEQSRTLAELAAWGFSEPGPGIDHVLVRGAASTPEQAWQPERRRIAGMLVSDHAPVEVTIE